jgi:hypothetical protein
MTSSPSSLIVVDLLVSAAQRMTTTEGSMVQAAVAAARMRLDGLRATLRQQGGPDA